MLLQPITSDLPCNYNTILIAQEDSSDFYCLMNVWNPILGDNQNLPSHSPLQPNLSWACFYLEIWSKCPSQISSYTNYSTVFQLLEMNLIQCLT